MYQTEEDVLLKSKPRLLRCHPGRKDKMAEEEVAGEEAGEAVVEREEVAGVKVDEVLGEVGKEVAGTKEDTVDTEITEGRRNDTSISI